MLELANNGIQKEYRRFCRMHTHWNIVEHDCCCPIFSYFYILLFAIDRLDLLFLRQCSDRIFTFPFILNNIFRLVADSKINNFHTSKLIKDFNMELDLLIEYSRNIPYSITGSSYYLRLQFENQGSCC
jgi:hypothetical protein